MLSEEYTEIVGDIFIGGEWQTHDLQPKIVALEEQLKIEQQKHEDTANWALEQQDRADVLETKLKDAETERDSLLSALTNAGWNYLEGNPEGFIAASEKQVVGLRRLLEKYPPTYLEEWDNGKFKVYCQACEGTWEDEPDAEQQHEDYCEYQKAIKEPAEADGR